MKKSANIRFWEKVHITDDCWEWTGTVLKDRGYGLFCLKNKRVRAHRYSYELIKGKIPPELVVDHLCRNRKCVNPAHLELVTPIENTKRGINATKKLCLRGHELFGKNLYLYTKKDGNKVRMCKACNKLRKSHN